MRKLLYIGGLVLVLGLAVAFLRLGPGSSPEQAGHLVDPNGDLNAESQIAVTGGR